MNDEIITLTNDEQKNSPTDDAFKIYMREVNRYPNLSIEQQKSLGYRYKHNNDLEAKEILISCTLQFVVSIALQYESKMKHLQILDIIQQGNLGLMRAIETYDPEQGSFTTYAKYWIEEKIKSGFKNMDSDIRKPMPIIEVTYRYLHLVKNYSQKNLPLPADEEICDILNITIGTLRNVRNSLNQNIISLNQTVDNDEKKEIGNIISVENYEYDNILNQMVDNNLLLVLKEVLNPLYYFVIYHRILSDEQKTLQEIADNFNVTRERVRQIEKLALKEIKPYMVKNSHFTKILNKIKQREGRKFNFLKTEPLSPTHIIQYMYLKDNLSDVERKLYELNLLGKYKYQNAEYASILKITLQELNQAIVSLKSKYNKEFSDKTSFEHFQKQMIKTYGTRIFKIDINEKK